MPDYTCSSCGRPFTVPQTALDRYPGWIPKVCLGCKKQKGGDGTSVTTGASAARSTSRRAIGPSRSGAGKAGSGTQELNLTVAEVLLRFTDGPKTGVFTDGAASPNPGPGGWGAVYVREDAIVGEKWGHEPHTTNNRMELLAIRAGIELVPSGEPTTIWTDSRLCVDTFNTWAKSWAARGWKRKTGEIKNLDMIKELYFALQQRPEIGLKWIAAHDGSRWNEYADALATAYRRKER
jgi:ribonuclease HI